MASIILRDIGSAVGNALLPGIGGAFLGTLGRSLGGLIDGQLGLGSSYEGPRLQNLGVQDSRYGAGIPITYGRMRTAGNIIWSTDLIQAQHTSSFSGGKGGGGSVSSTTYTYSVHCAAGVALGPIGGISTIWADSTIIYQNGVWTAGVVDGAAIYTGTATQTPDAFMQSILGSANVPAYRGLAYVVFENLQLANFGNRLPNLTFEIVPGAATNDPAFLGGVDASVSQRTQTAQSGGMPPLVLQGNGSGVSAILVGGYVPSGSTCVFEAVEYDVTDATPVELTRASSASFTAADPVDTSWALAPDNRYVALYFENGSPATHNLAIYDIETRQFGAVIAPGMAVSSGTRQIAWLDPQHLVIDDTSGGVRGLRVFVRAGLDLVDLGFHGVWGAGSATSRSTLAYMQFMPFAGGLLNIMTDNTTGTYFSAIYACTLAWRNNALAVGTSYTIVSGISTGTGSGPHANLVRTGDSEWTLCFGTVLDFHLISFEPGASAATVTRPWQTFTPGFGTGSTNFPLYYGDRLVIVQCGVSGNFYRISEVMLDTGGFTRTIDGIAVSGGSPYGYFGALALDSARFLVMGIAGFAFDIQQLGIYRRCATGDGLDAIVGDILARAGYAVGDYDVSALAGASVDGYVLQNPMTARAAIEPLQVFLPFDLVESAAQLKAVPRGGTADVAIPSGEWRAGPDGKEPPPPLEVTRAQELDLPLEVDVDYIDAARDFEVNSQCARRIASRAQSVQKIALPIVCNSDTAKQIAETRLYSLWAERELVRLRISRRWLALDPGDVVDLGNGSLLRVTGINQAGGLMEVEGFYVNVSVYASAAAADAGQGAGRLSIVPLASTLYLMDMPLLQSADDQPGVYAAATGLPGWTSASLFRASDGVNYNNVASLPMAAAAGIATTVLPDGLSLYIDRASTVNVQLLNGTLSSCSETNLYGGINAALLGNEIVQFETATLIGPGLYTLSNLLRGRRGTESASGTHAVGESFVLLTAGTVEFIPALLTDRGRMYEFRALTKGQALGDAQDTDFTYGLATLRPFSPASLSGARASGTGSDLTLSWKRRARLNADWVDYVDVPLDEPAELYDVEIMNGSNVIRLFSSVTTPTVTYTAAQQSADWGTVPASFNVNVYQIGARYGRGEPATGTV